MPVRKLLRLGEESGQKDFFWSDFFRNVEELAGHEKRTGIRNEELRI
jgi:hypothetical protein